MSLTVKTINKDNLVEKDIYYLDSFWGLQFSVSAKPHFLGSVPG